MTSVFLKCDFAHFCTKKLQAIGQPTANKYAILMLSGNCFIS